MEKVIAKLKDKFANENFQSNREKLACAIGYLECNDDVNKNEAIQIIKKVFFDEL